MQTQRQLQTSLEAHGRYISSLIEPQASVEPVKHDNNSLLDMLPPLELAVPDALQKHFSETPLSGANLGSSWDLGRSSGTHVNMPGRLSAVSSFKGHCCAISN